MKNDKVSETNVIAVFTPGIEKIHGWMSLSRQKQDKLLEHNSRRQQYLQMRTLGEFGELLEITQIQHLLKGEKMQLEDYLAAVYPSKSQKTIERKQQIYAEFAATIPIGVLEEISSLGAEALTKFERIANAPLGEIRSALRQVKLLPVSTKNGAEKLLGELEEKIIEGRKQRSQPDVTRISKDQTEKMALHAVLHYMKSAKLRTSSQKGQWLTRVIGWTMESQAIPGVLRLRRISVPDGMIIRRGRPRTRSPQGAESES